MNYADMLYKSSPDYLMAYKAGFEDAQVTALHILNKAFEDIRKLKAISETSATTSFKEG